MIKQRDLNTLIDFLKKNNSIHVDICLNVPMMETVLKKIMNKSHTPSDMLFRAIVRVINRLPNNYVDEFEIFEKSIGPK